MYNHKGSALLTALFIMTLIAIVTTAVTVRLQQDIYRTRLVITHNKLYFASQLVTFWSMEQLNNKTLKFYTTNKQGMVSEYPKNMAEHLKNITLSGGVFDLQARFNLNNIVEKKFVTVFANLLKQAAPKTTNTERFNIIQALKDWTSPYDLSKGKDSYISYYLEQKPPYYPSHQLLTNVSEFRLIKDVSAALFQTLEPFIATLPEITPININTAPKVVLMSLGDGLKDEYANEIIMARQKDGIKNLSAISEIMKKINVPDEQITLDSSYFLSVSYARMDAFHLAVYTVLKRGKSKEGNITVSVISETVRGF